jgi:alpha-amylase
MKRIFALAVISAFSISAFAKKVKFMVDMDTVTINVNGIHVTGDFQVAAGFAADWDPSTTAMTQEVSDPSIYSVVVNIPAFKKYEFKFVNGIFGYEVEFVPAQSRVGYQFNDNRWIYIDSLSNDTQVVSPVIYSQNAPAKKHLLRFRVDMRNVATVDPKGVHVAGNFQGFDPSKIYMYSFDGDIFEYIAYVDTGIPTFDHEFKYYNGNTAGTSEAVPLVCANVSGNRAVKITSDSVLSAVCFAGCSPCVGNSIAEIDEQQIKVYPNPSKGEFQVTGFLFNAGVLNVFNIFGEKVLEKPINLKPETINLSVSGVYFLRIESNGKTFSEKIVVE